MATEQDVLDKLNEARGGAEVGAGLEGHHLVTLVFTNAVNTIDAAILEVETEDDNWSTVNAMLASVAQLLTIIAGAPIATRDEVNSAGLVAEDIIGAATFIVELTSA